MNTPRRHFSTGQKATILKRYLVDKVPISDLCDEFGIKPNQIYAWQKILFDHAETAFQQAGGRTASKASAQEDKIARLEKENKELATKLDAALKTANLDMQAKCAQEARLVYNESGLKREEKDAWSDYTNHYNRRLNKCFVMFDTSQWHGSGFTVYKSVLDAFEGRGYGEYFWSNPRDKPAWEVKPTVCRVTLLSGEHKDCESVEEFEQLIKVYMEQ